MSLGPKGPQRLPATYTCTLVHKVEVLSPPAGQLLRTNSGSFANPAAGGGGGPGSVVSDRSGVSRTPSGQLRSASWQQPPLQRTNSGHSGNGLVRSTSGTGAGVATGAGAGMNRANSFGAVSRSVSASDGSAGGLIGPRDAANPLAQVNLVCYLSRA